MDETSESAKGAQLAESIMELLDGHQGRTCIAAVLTVLSVMREQLDGEQLGDFDSGVQRAIDMMVGIG